MCGPLPYIGASVADNSGPSHLGDVINIRCMYGHRYEDGTDVQTIRCDSDGWNWLANVDMICHGM